MVNEPPPLTADSPFSYACTRCSRCCADKFIQVNPYEVARLARSQGMTTTAFRDRFTDGARLNQDEAGRCVFLGPDGCSVHADRPLVCRLFPLGRIIDEDGDVHFSRPRFEPEAAGRFGSDATIADYVATQGAEPFIAAADAYFDWYCRARHCDPDAVAPDGDPLDLDAQVAAWCRARGVEEPADIDERRRLHLLMLDQLIDGGGSNARN